MTRITLSLAGVALALAAAAGAEAAVEKVATVDVGKACDIAFQGGRAYVSTENGLSVLDVSDPASPKVLGSVSTQPGNLGVAVSGNRAYIANRAPGAAAQKVNDAEGGLIALDVSDPSAPKKVASQPISRFAWDVAVKDNAVYVINFKNILHVFDASSGAPKKAKEINVKGEGRAKGMTTGVRVSGNHLVVSSWEGAPVLGMWLYDVSDAMNPKFKGHNYAYFILQTAIHGDWMYGVCGYSGKSGTYSAHIPTLIAKETTDSTKDFGYNKAPYSIDQGGIGVSSDGRYVFEVMADNGVMRVLDASDPKNMKEVQSVKLGATGVRLAEIVGIEPIGEYVYVCAGQSGLQVFRVPGSGAGVKDVPPRKSPPPKIKKKGGAAENGDETVPPPPDKPPRKPPKKKGGPPPDAPAGEGQ